ncbi:transposase [Psychrobacter cibarius]|uniref:transposase n=1 Tax=Psychrobacter cibarius TaxID=282669 RepID=UPI00191A2874
MNGDIFYNWCKNTLIPSLKIKCVIVMDNASFHKRVQRLLNRHGHRLLFLPPYSPDLNPIEKNGHRLSFYDKGGWRIIYLSCFMIWVVPILFWIDYIK